MEEIKSLHPSSRFANADNSDLSLGLEIKSTSKVLNTLDITDFLSISDQFESERQNSEKHRVFANFNYVSFLRYLNNDFKIQSIFDIFEDKNNKSKEYNFDEFFEIKVVIPYKFDFFKAIDEDKSLYKVFYKSYSGVSYNIVRSAYQQNSYNEIMWNLVSNQIIDLYGESIYIDDLDKYIPLTEISLYLNLKAHDRITEKSVKNDFLLNNLFLDSSTTYGYNDNTFDFDSFNNLIIDQELIKLNNKVDSGFHDAEFLSKVRKKLFLFFKLKNIELIDNNIIINKAYLKNYLEIIRDDVEYLPFLQQDENINGGLVIFDKNDFSWIKTERVEHKFNLDYEYTNEEYIQFAKEMTFFLEDYTNIYYPTVSLSNTKAKVLLNRFYKQNGAFIGSFRIDQIGLLNQYINNYNLLTETLPNPVRFNDFQFNIQGNNIIMGVKRKSKITQINNDKSDTELKVHFKYDPFIDVKVKEFSTSLEISEDPKNISIPSYALFKNNLYKWRDVLDKGFIEPDTNVGFDYPFLNDATYIDNNFRFYVSADKSEAITSRIFSDFKTNLAINGFNGSKGGFNGDINNGDDC